MIKSKSKSGKKSSGIPQNHAFRPGTAKRLGKKAASEFRRLAPSELRGLGYSPKSERYVEKSARRLTKSTPTLSKRQVDQKRLTEEAGHRVTLEQRALEYLTGKRQATSARAAELREKAKTSWELRRKYPGESVKRIRQHIHNIELKARGEYLPPDVYLREKAFSEAHIELLDERSNYQKWFNYGHVSRRAAA